MAEFQYGEIVVDDSDRTVRKWKRTGSPFYRVGYEAFSEFASHCPWPFTVTRNEHGQRLLVLYIDTMLPNEATAPGLDMLKTPIKFALENADAA